MSQHNNTFQFNPQGLYGSNQNILSGGKNFMGQNINYDAPSSTQAFGQGTNNMSSDIMSQYGSNGMGNGIDFGQGDSGMAFGDMLGLGGQAFGIGAGLYDTFVNKPQMMGMAKEQLGLQKQAYNDNKANRDRFVGDAAKAFA